MCFTSLSLQISYKIYISIYNKVILRSLSFLSKIEKQLNFLTNHFHNHNRKDQHLAFKKSISMTLRFCIVQFIT